MLSEPLEHITNPNAPSHVTVEFSACFTEKRKKSQRSHQCICLPRFSGKAESWTWIPHLATLNLFQFSAQVQESAAKWVIARWSSLTLQAKDSQVPEGVQVWTLQRSERIITIIFYSLLFNLNMNKIPNPSYHSIHSPMTTSQEEEADTASESETMAQNKLLHSCSLETFFQGLQGLLFLPWGNYWDCIFPIPLQLTQPHLSSLLASLSSLVISASSSIFISQLNQAYLLALLWLI